MKHNLITWQELKKVVDIAAFSDIDENLMNEIFNQYDLGTGLFFPGDWKVDGNFSLETVTGLKEDVEFIYVHSDLIVHGDFNPLQETLATIFLVNGNMRAHSWESGEHLMIINGNLNIKTVIAGYQNHGCLYVRGITSAQFIVNNDHEIRLNTIQAQHVMCVGPGEMFDTLPYNATLNELLKSLKADYIEESIKISLDREKLLLHLQQNIDVLKPGHQVLTSKQVLSLPYHELLQVIHEEYLLKIKEYDILLPKLVSDIKAGKKVFAE